MTAANQPVRIGRRDPDRILIEWADGHTTEFTAAALMPSAVSPRANSLRDMSWSRNCLNKSLTTNQPPK